MLVALYKWLTGTISLCGSVCPENCILIFIIDLLNRYCK